MRALFLKRPYFYRKSCRLLSTYYLLDTPASLLASEQSARSLNGDHHSHLVSERCVGWEGGWVWMNDHKLVGKETSKQVSEMLTPTFLSVGL